MYSSHSDRAGIRPVPAAVSLSLNSAVLLGIFLGILLGFHLGILLGTLRDPCLVRVHM